MEWRAARWPLSARVHLCYPSPYREGNEIHRTIFQKTFTIFPPLLIARFIGLRERTASLPPLFFSRCVALLRARESRFEWPRTSSRGHRRQRYRERNGERRGATGRSEKIGEERARSRGTIRPWGKEKGEEGRRKGLARDEEGTMQWDLFPLASRERMQFKTHTGDRVSSTHTRAWTSLTTSSRTISSCYSFPLVLAASSFNERRKASPLCSKAISRPR